MSWSVAQHDTIPSVILWRKSARYPRLFVRLFSTLPARCLYHHTSRFGGPSEV